MDKVIVVIGPTASGKSKLAVELAKIIGGEIISADSMQIYKFMDIGTAKPDSAEMQGIKHHLIDEIYPDEEFSVAKFQQLAVKYIDEIIKKGCIPIVAGGTGLYINSLIYNINFSETISDWALREELKKEAEEKGNRYLHQKLEGIDPEAAGKIHENDVKRVIRAIEVFKHTGRTISYHQQISRIVPPKYKFAVVGLKMDRQKLYAKIDKRVDSMIDKGLADEVGTLLRLGYDKNAVAMQGLGYKEILACLKGETSFYEAIEIIKKETRHYAKRQMTWFKRIEGTHWIDLDKCCSQPEMLENLKFYLATFGIFL